MMTRLIVFALLLTQFVCQAQTNISVIYSFVNGLGQTQTVKQVSFTPLAFGLDGKAYVVGDETFRVITSASYTNPMLSGFSYRVKYFSTIQPPTLTACFTNSFSTNVTGTVYAADYTAISTNLSNGLYAYSMAASDALFASLNQSTNIALVAAKNATNGLPSSVWTLGTASAQNTNVFLGTNFTVTTLNGLTNKFSVDSTGKGTLTIGNTNSTFSNVVTNQYQVGRVFYVATNGNDSTGVIGNPDKPFSGTNLSSLVTGVCFLATNYGDIIYLEPGRYYPTGEIQLAKGITLCGVASDRKAVVLVATNTGVINVEKCIIDPSDNCIIKDFTWTNSTTTLYGPFIGTSTGNGNLAAGGISFTNVLLDNLVLLGGYDGFFGSADNVSTNYFTIRNSYIRNLGDIVAMQFNVGLITSVNNVWDEGGIIGGTMQACATCPMHDIGSLFIGVGAKLSQSVFQNITFDGSRFTGNTQSNLDSEIANTNSFNSGTYINVDNGISRTVGTFSSVKPFTIGGNYYQVGVEGMGSPDTAANGIFTLKSSVGDIVNYQNTDTSYLCAQAVYTNASAYVVMLNNPQDIVDQGFGMPTWSLNKTNRAGGLLYADFTVLPVPTNTASIVTNAFSAYNGTGAAGGYYFTTNTVPSAQAIYFTQSFYGGAVALDQNGQNPLLAGNGSGITNIAASSIVASSMIRTINAITLGASPFSWTNKTGVTLECYFTGSVAYAVAKNGTTVFGSLASDGYFALQPTNYVTITYTVAPTFYTNAW